LLQDFDWSESDDKLADNLIAGLERTGEQPVGVACARLIASRGMARKQHSSRSFGRWTGSGARLSRPIHTHRVAIANSRLVSLANAEVAFRWKDYRHHGKTKLMTLAADEFIRRFLLHTLPDGFIPSATFPNFIALNQRTGSRYWTSTHNYTPECSLDLDGPVWTQIATPGRQPSAEQGDLAAR